jgi:hypothetical protein
MPTLESVILLSLALWLLYFLVNHAEMFRRLRTAVMPALPNWLRYPLECALCLPFWVLVAASLLTGWTPMVLWVPPVVLGLDLCYRRLSGKGCE